MSEISIKRVRKTITMARNGTQNDGSLRLIDSPRRTLDCNFFIIGIDKQIVTFRSSIHFISKSLEFLHLLPDLIRTSYKGSENLFRTYVFRENRCRESNNLLMGVNKITLTRAP